MFIRNSRFIKNKIIVVEQFIGRLEILVFAAALGAFLTNDQIIPRIVKLSISK